MTASIDTTCITGMRYLDQQENPVTLHFFEPKGNQSRRKSLASIIYGANGAGKSTLSNAIRRISEGTEDAWFLAGDSPIDNPGDAIDNINVFDEEFIANNFSVNADNNGLGTIVLLGEQVEVNEQIERNLSIIRNLSGKLDKTEGVLTEAKSNVERSRKDLEKALKEDGGWAERSQRINRTKNKSRVNESVLQKISECLFSGESQELVELSDSFQSALDEYLEASVSSEISWKLDPVTNPFSVLQVEEVLGNLSQPTVQASNQLEELVAAANLSAPKLEQLEELFGNPSLDRCPTCFQNVGQSHKDALLNTLGKALTQIRESDVGKAALNQKKSLDFSFNIPDDLRLSKEFLGRSELAFRKLAESVQAINGLLDKKIDSPNVALRVDWTDLEDSMTEVNRIIAEISKEVDSHNTRVRDAEVTKARLERTNYHIAALECRDRFYSFARSFSAGWRASERKNDLESRLSSLRSSTRQLESQKLRVEDAAGEINKLLGLVFGELSIRLDYDGGVYKILRNGSPVPPYKLSTGERNIVALAYFFVSTAENQDIKNAAKSNQLLVLDDPISSFDYDNKYGVVAMLCRMLKLRLSKGSESQVLVLTHDQTVAYDLSKVLLQILDGAEGCFLLSEGNLSRRKFDDIDVYANLLRTMFDIAFRGSEVSKVSSNDIRRVFEAFIAFELNVSVSDAGSYSLLEKHIAGLGDEYESFLQSFVARVFIHPDSHAEGNVLNFDFHLVPKLSEENQRRFIRDILFFIHILSPLHVASRCGGKKDEREKRLNEINRALDSLLVTI